MLERTPLSSPVLGRRKFILGSAFLVSAGAAAAMVPRRKIDLLGDKKLEKIVPDRIGPWSFYSKSGLVVPPSDELSEWLYSQLLTRVYVASDQLPIMLLIAQSASQSGVLQVHRPEVCYPAGGYTLSPPMRQEISLGDRSLQTVGFTATGDSRTEQLLYWTRIGSDVPTSWAEQRWSVARANLSGEVPDAVLVRVSTVSTERQEALDVLQRFARSLIDSVPASLRPFFTGTA
jgi:EpsI family protein